MKTTLFCASLAIGVALSALTAQADTTVTRSCADRDKIVNRLETAYGEVRQSVGLGTNNSMMEIFASEETGTWTITVTLPSGKTCLLASGQAFESLPEAARKMTGKDT